MHSVTVVAALGALLLSAGCDSAAPAAARDAVSAPGDDQPSDLIASASDTSEIWIDACPVDAESPLLWRFSMMGLAENTLADLTLTWDFGDGGVAVGDEVSHAFEASGDYVVTIVATLTDGTCQFTRYGAIRVQGVGAAIPAEGGLRVLFQATVEEQGVFLVFEAVARSTSLRDGEEIAYEWVFADGFTRLGPEAVHILRDVDPYRVTLNALTSQGRTATYTQVFTLPATPTEW